MDGKDTVGATGVDFTAAFENPDEVDDRPPNDEGALDSKKVSNQSA